MHENPTFTFKNRAAMIRSTSAKQLTIAEFDWPFDTALDKTNRWINAIFLAVNLLVLERIFLSSDNAALLNGCLHSCVSVNSGG